MWGVKWSAGLFSAEAKCGDDGGTWWVCRKGMCVVQGVLFQCGTQAANLGRRRANSG